MVKTVKEMKEKRVGLMDLIEGPENLTSDMNGDALVAAVRVLNWCLITRKIKKKEDKNNKKLKEYGLENPVK